MKKFASFCENLDLSPKNQKVIDEIKKKSYNDAIKDCISKLESEKASKEVIDKIKKLLK